MVVSVRGACPRCGSQIVGGYGEGSCLLCGYEPSLVAYQRAYNQAHREERVAHKRAYYQAHHEELAAHQRAYRQAHHEEEYAKIGVKS